VATKNEPNYRQISIVTSIAPHGIDNQRLAIASWRAHGFRAVSLNSKEEIAILQPSFPDIEFMPVKRDARKSYGKPFVYFDDFLSYLHDHDDRICGIVNSDIHLISHHALLSYFSREAKNGLVFGSRIDVDSLANLQGKMYHMGFDFFFFDRKLLDIYPPEEFCIGQPWWDYWMPIVALGKSIPVKRLMTPIAFHLNHAINWNPSIRTHLGMVMAKYIRTPEPVSEKNMMQFLHYVCRIIREKSTELYLEEAGETHGNG